MATQRVDASTWAVCLLFSVLTVAPLTVPGMTADPSPSIVFYTTVDASSMVVLPSPSGTFGTINVVDSVSRAGKPLDSPVIGESAGRALILKAGNFYLDFVFIFDTPSYAGTITSQGETDPAGNGELAITGGTGAFRRANGYIELKIVTDSTGSSFFEVDVYFL